MKMMNSSPAPTRNFNSSTSEFLPLICAWLIYPLSSRHFRMHFRPPALLARRYDPRLVLQVSTVWPATSRSKARRRAGKASFTDVAVCSTMSPVGGYMRPDVRRASRHLIETYYHASFGGMAPPTEELHTLQREFDCLTSSNSTNERPRVQ